MTPRLHNRRQQRPEDLLELEEPRDRPFLQIEALGHLEAGKGVGFDLFGGSRIRIDDEEHGSTSSLARTIHRPSENAPTHKPPQPPTTSARIPADTGDTGTSHPRPSWVDRASLVTQQPLR